MSFPQFNAISVVGNFGAYDQQDGLTPHMYLATGQHNLCSVPAVVDVSAMEFALSLGVLANTVVARYLAATGACTVQLTMADGGVSGEPTTVVPLFAGSLIWSDHLTTLTTTVVQDMLRSNVGIDAAGTSATDLDADDWLNLDVMGNATGLLGLANINANFVYGKPGMIN